ncbi:TetR/AcrR family transcriptional regulator [Massilia sp. RP-1-19]|uniref:TetR/AcrR family transcriptional regulator n=1 Tax=Massilia polaris TaxID=2728846 RepID=A0A848HS33_9BURK|nr:TetR/AcrR family transcriptional regulator [Massilia polaris]NML62551.1 TetR/AcrR family transcriptional regulator [Massilia polaris]
MKVSKQQAAQNRERVVETAAKLFREHGYNGIGVADLMKAAGMTHGGFYAKFGSKEALLAEAAAKAIEVSMEDWDRVVAKQPGDPLRAVTEAYLSPLHRDQIGRGCAIAALGPELSRLSDEVRDAVTDGVSKQIDKLTPIMHQADPQAQRQSALAAYAAMVGALVLARAVTDEKLSAEMMDAVLESINRAV